MSSSQQLLDAAGRRRSPAETDWPWMSTPGMLHRATSIGPDAHPDAAASARRFRSKWQIPQTRFAQEEGAPRSACFPLRREVARYERTTRIRRID